MTERTESTAQSWVIDVCGECGERVLGAEYSCSNLHLGPNKLVEVVPRSEAEALVRELAELLVAGEFEAGDDEAQVYEALQRADRFLGTTGAKHPKETP